jgi:hypothetical protein
VGAQPLGISVPVEEELSFCGYLRQFAIDTLSEPHYVPPRGER